MRRFYGWATPNSQRVSIMLEECGLTYEAIGVNIRAREQFAPAIVALNPYGKIPILVEDGLPPLFESGAILIHLAETHGRFLPRDPAARAQTLAWLMVALTSLGPMTGQAHHWTDLAPEKPEAARRHTVGLVERVYRLLEGRLTYQPHLAGADYSIADIAAYPWIARHAWATLSLDDWPAIARWFAQVGARPAVLRGMQVPAGARLD
ncbi:glutathione S-transferase family protein [Roseomonas sp. PWR1]|uniref:Glutathione S-transferase family protein n=1 Tax=Roseomonas nitratireducens TaxID=2820810 RepID=A0ABS4AZL9_9PROT|nr:glutathione S-transferase family protein [Neoroseomonas nitratireducens]MBP0466816.1 glutathione S-transferase family protein [Neoroseomonas nitratireducens]